MIASLKGEVVTELVLPFGRGLRHIYVSSNLNTTWKSNSRIGSHSQYRVVEILEVERELVQRCRADRRRVVDDEAIEFVVSRVSAGQSRW